MKLKCILIISILLFTSLISAFYALKNKRNNKILVERYKSLETEYYNQQSMMIKYFEKNDFSSQGEIKKIGSISDTRINVDNITLTTVDRGEVKLSDVIDNETLVFRFNQSKSCGSCIDRVISILEEFGGLIGNNRIILIGKFEYLKYLIVFKEINFLEFQVYNYTKHWINNFEGENVENEQFLGIIDENLLFKMLHIPSSNDSIKDEYYQKVLEELK